MRDGAARLPGLIANDLPAWEAATRHFFNLGKPGHRISGSPGLAKLAAQTCRSFAFEEAAGVGWRCVRAVAFNKTPSANWALGWHQDRTIAVARREEVSGYNVWSSKDGVPHVEPPFEVLERMVTLRVHLDPVDDENAPLLIALSSHRRGKVAEAAIDRAVSVSDIVTCHADTGDGWLYATPILHASSRSMGALSRRVVQLDFSRDTLPSPLAWAEIG